MREARRPRARRPRHPDKDQSDQSQLEFPFQPDPTPSHLSVDDLTAYIQGVFNTDLVLKFLLVAGEIAEFKRHASGHCYFTLLGEETRIACALFKRDADLLPRWPENGDSVLVEGSVGIYPQRGVYQLYARSITPVGAGAIDRARQETRQRLEQEGLFHPSLKRPLPPFPSRAAVLTSPTGAALRDVLRISSRRYPLCDIIVVPALVQGAGAPSDIVRAFRLIAGLGDLDCVLLVRGGGSREDLVPFDDERVVRAVRGCPFPVVSGVGHEIDETLCDLAADVRASTPSAAAELVFPDRSALKARLSLAEGELRRQALRRIEDGREAVRECTAGLRAALGHRVVLERTGLRSKFQSLASAMGLRLSKARGLLAVRSASLNALSPLAVLARGFVTAERGARRLVSVQGLGPGDEMSVHFADGRAECLVQSVRPFIQKPEKSNLSNP